MDEVDNEISSLILARQPIFLANRRVDLEKMRAALAESNFELIRSIGHNCKGTGSGYGFPEVSKLGAAIETAAKAADAPRVSESVDLLEQCVAAASGAIPVATT